MERLATWNMPINPLHICMRDRVTKKMFELFLFLNGNDTFWPSWRVHMIILFFLTCTGGTGK